MTEKSAPPRPIPEADDVSGPFWEAAARRELVLQKCAGCGRFRYPPRPMCPHCQSLEHAWEPAAGRGRVWSWVIVHPPTLPAFADKVPYSVAVVDLPEGVRMLGNLLGVPNEEVAAGMEVVVDFEDVGEGVVLPQWRPA